MINVTINVRFDVFIIVLLRIQVFCDVTVCRYVSENVSLRQRQCVVTSNNVSLRQRVCRYVSDSVSLRLTMCRYVSDSVSLRE